MSKTALKKELSGFTKEQLIEVVLDLYSERKDVRDYFNFFLNPDSEKLAEKYRRLINKEFGRSKWSRSKARISVIRKLLKEFRSFHPDSKYIHLIYVQTIYLGLYYEDTLYFTDTLCNGVCKLVDEYLEYADGDGRLDDGLCNIDTLIQTDAPGGKSFKRAIADACQGYLNRKSI